MQSGTPESVRDCLLKWKDGVVLSEDAKRLLMLYAQCADKNSHIWFCPPAPEEAEQIPWSSLLPKLHRDLCDCWYDHIHGARRRLSREMVRHNYLPPLDYVRNVVQSWLSEIPIPLQLLSSSPRLSDDSQVELQDDCFGQKHSILIRDLRTLVRYHKLASKISASSDKRNITNIFYAGRLPKHEKEPDKCSALARFIACCFSAHASSVRTSLQKQVATFFTLAEYMHVPASQGHSSGSWLVDRNPGKAEMRSKLSFMECEKFWVLSRERKIDRKDTAELCWRLEDFQRKAKRHNVTYLGRPRETGQPHMSMPDLEEWLTNCAVRLPACLG